MSQLNKKLSTDLRGKYILKPATEDFLVEMHNTDPTKILIQWHWHEAFEAGIVLKGSVEINVESEKYTINEGEGYVLKTEVVHSISPLGKGEHSMNLILFHPRVVGGSEASVLWKKYLIPLANDPTSKIVPLTNDVPWENEARSLIESSWDHMSNAENGYEFMVRNDLSKLIYLCILNSTNTSDLSEKTQRDADRLRVMMNYIQEHFNEEITTEMIAQSAMISESECQRCFKRLIKISPISYLRRFRIQKSAELLADKNLKISDVALKCGFQEMSYYSSIFKKMYGVTPGEYRASL